ncbi:hypothetical protein VR7878_00383 [Vibrio ruber DSM 16370]|uniref:Uncharacterized protein n=1 Tax=Vibrio ruber (strain DSM 16370 / JCM 11486 / BCRC 17186 / CECT 7878 / LMG 23124 / VR1) TaxID=1123498 RepID=A0A1R4LBC1_VIBR1|nr:hypothetical protein [Vibrio ruber]SJN53564.1 hypothetical protein VR7878_00383 [Vibrio ruber DSM 16370]
MYEIILRGISIYALVWMIVFFICMMRYSFGDREHVYMLIRKLAKDPQWYFNKNSVMFTLISGMSAGGVLVIYSLIYPFIVHRSIKRGYKMDLMMWLHWLWWVCFLFPWSYVV